MITLKNFLKTLNPNTNVRVMLNSQTDWYGDGKCISQDCAGNHWVRSWEDAISAVGTDFEVLSVSFESEEGMVFEVMLKEGKNAATTNLAHFSNAASIYNFDSPSK